VAERAPGRVRVLAAVGRRHAAVPIEAADDGAQVVQRQRRHVAAEPVAHHDAQHGDFLTKRFGFTALNDKTSFVFQSLDKPVKSNCGPVIAGVSVRSSQ